MSAHLKIVVAEPSLIIRKGILSVLRHFPDFEVQVVEVSDPVQLPSSLAWQKPDILILNPVFSGAISLQQLRSRLGRSGLRCVALQHVLADSSVLKAYDEVISVYDTAEEIREKLLRLTASDEESSERRDALSVREKEIVVCVAKGMTNKQIADKLCLSAHTVITHRRNIASKLQIHSSAGLVIYAIVNKLVELNDVKETIRKGRD